jgi:hypothetical protein
VKLKLSNDLNNLQASLNINQPMQNKNFPSSLYSQNSGADDNNMSDD